MDILYFLVGGHSYNYADNTMDTTGFFAGLIAAFIVTAPFGRLLLACFFIKKWKQTRCCQIG